MPPSVFFGEPNEFVAVWQIPPAGSALAGFKLRTGSFLVDIADVARRGISDPKTFLLVIARGRNKCQGLTVRAPIDIVPAAVARNVVALSRAVLIGRHF